MSHYNNARDIDPAKAARLVGIMHRLGKRRAFYADICHWTGCMFSAARVTLPGVRADRLRSAAEFRQEMAHAIRQEHARTRAALADF